MYVLSGTLPFILLSLLLDNTLSPVFIVLIQFSQHK